MKAVVKYAVHCKLMTVGIHYVKKTIGKLTENKEHNNISKFFLEQQSPSLGWLIWNGFHFKKWGSFIIYLISSNT